MKKILALILSYGGVLPVFAQCGNATCPAGSITTLPAGGTIPAGTTYCISGPISSSTAYTVDGTLIIRSGVVSIGNLTVDKTGSVIVVNGARFNTLAFTGQAISPASAISNVTVCSNAFMSMTGAINQNEINFTVNDYGVLLSDGSWTSSATDTYFKIGKGSLIEMCNTFAMHEDGFFTETSTSPSYLLTRGAVTQNTINGWLSSKDNSSNIMWTALAGLPAFLQYNTADACFSPACEPSTLAPGSTDNGSCGSVAGSYNLMILSLGFLDAQARLSGSSLLISADLSTPAQQLQLESSANGSTFIAVPYESTASSNVDGSTHYLFTLPAADGRNYHRIHLFSENQSVYSQVFPPIPLSGAAGGPVFPDPATDFVYLNNPSGAAYTQAAILSSTGQLLQSIGLPANIPLVRVDLPRSLSPGIYLIRFSGAGVSPFTVRVLKNR